MAAVGVPRNIPLSLLPTLHLCSLKNRTWGRATPSHTATWNKLHWHGSLNTATVTLTHAAESYRSLRILIDVWIACVSSMPPPLSLWISCCSSSSLLSALTALPLPVSDRLWYDCEPAVFSQGASAAVRSRLNAAWIAAGTGDNGRGSQWLWSPALALNELGIYRRTTWMKPMF